MTCEVCQHCQETVSQAEGYTVHAGFSYHKQCHKCYVCSETNLQNAEVFQGVIFCSSCSQRIFQGCSTARRTKSGNRSRHKRSRSKSKAKKRPCSPIKGDGRFKSPIPPGVIQLAQLAAESRSSENLVDESKKLELTTELALQVGKRIYEELPETWDDLKKNSAEIGVTTDVTQDLLRQMKCPVVDNRIKYKSHIPRMKHRHTCDIDPIPNPRNSKCSDWRIAELGASTEIASMVLRKKSELPVIIRSMTQIEKKFSIHPSCLNRESDVSGDSYEDWLTGSCGKDSENGIMALREGRFGSFLKIPVRCFKRNILNRSSLVDVMINKESDKNVFFEKIKTIFHEAVTSHQRRGIKRLYSTINRRKVPYRMGWPHLNYQVSRVFRIKHPECNKGMCKHFKTSHSYRCMRAQVMRKAGPTKSELAEFRLRLKNMIVPNCIKNAIFNSRHAELMSRACGSNAVAVVA